MRPRFKRSIFANCCSSFHVLKFISNKIYTTNTGLLKIRQISRVKNNYHIGEQNNEKC